MPEYNKIILNKQEKTWILEQRVTRVTDQQEVLIYPMGAERFLALALSGLEEGRYAIQADIENKDVLVIPGYGNSAFLFAEAGAKSVIVYDKDPVTIAWMKTFKKYYHYRQYDPQGKPYPCVGELLAALTSWYPPLIALPSGKLSNRLFWLISPKALRRAYIFYMLALVKEAVKSKAQDDFELNKNIQFYAGELEQLIKGKTAKVFDTAFVPYLLGVRNGIENENDIVIFIEKLIQLVPDGSIVVTPSRKTKEFYVKGQSYFETTGYTTIESIPNLEKYVVAKDKYWFKTQGLTVFGLSQDKAHK